MQHRDPVSAFLDGLFELLLEHLAFGLFELLTLGCNSRPELFDLRLPLFFGAFRLLAAFVGVLTCVVFAASSVLCSLCCIFDLLLQGSLLLLQRGDRPLVLTITLRVCCSSSCSRLRRCCGLASACIVCICSSRPARVACCCGLAALRVDKPEWLIWTMLPAPSLVFALRDPELHAVCGLLVGAWFAKPTLFTGNGERVAVFAVSMPFDVAIASPHSSNSCPTSAVVGQQQRLGSSQTPFVATPAALGDSEGEPSTLSACTQVPMPGRLRIRGRGGCKVRWACTLEDIAS